MLYIANINGQTVGPATKAQLATAGMNDATLVKSEERADWIAAGSIPELRAFFDNKPFDNQFPLETVAISIIAQNGFNTSLGKMLIFDDYVALCPNHGSSAICMNFTRTGYRRQFFGVEDITAYNSGFLAKCSVELREIGRAHV